MEKDEINLNTCEKVYELGYLILPTVPEEHVAAEVQNIRTVIENNKGVFITEEFPKLRQLAFSMKKTSTGQNLKFDKAYFGWVKFDAPSSAISEIEKEMKKNSNILRFMVINTVRENTMYSQKTVFRPATLAADAPKSEDTVKMSEEEIEKTIEKLVVE
jgi:small subunit ribosomal protein S6